MINVALIDGIPGSTYTQGLPDLIPALQQYDTLVAKAWGLEPATIHYAKNVKVADPSMWWLTVNLTSDTPGALGWHDLHPGGLPYGEVFAGDDARFGASLSVTITHELAEMRVDPWITSMWFDGQRYWLREVGDPVEDDLYAFDINGVLVSDFVLPSFYSIKRPPPYDYCGRLRRGCPSLLSGGYISYLENNQWHQINARYANGTFSYRALRYGRSARAGVKRAPA